MYTPSTIVQVLDPTSKMTSGSYYLFMNSVPNYMSGLFYTPNSILCLIPHHRLLFLQWNWLPYKYKYRCCMWPLCFCLLYTTMLDSIISSMPMGHCLHNDNIAMIMMGADVVAYSFIMVITPCLSYETISSEKN